ncbi:MAG TPA: tetratricopeptide repeat protein [Armatimonadota bacterium]|jgi:predicted ATPase/DNA-binding SARP family transcriptional activator
MTVIDPATPCRIEMLGGLRLLIAGRTIVRFRSVKVAELLALLACHPDRPMSRDAVVEALWPEVDPDKGRNRLRFTLSCLRRQVEPVGVPQGTVVSAGRSHLTLRGDNVSTDLAEFEASVRAADRASDDGVRIEALRQAAGLFAGPFMEGFYETWIEERRERLSESILTVLGELARLLEDRNDLAGALDAARRAVALDPWREEAHRSILRVHLARDERAEALKHYAHVEQTFMDDMGVAPAPETRALIANLLSGSHPAADSAKPLPAPSRRAASSRAGGGRDRSRSPITVEVSLAGRDAKLEAVRLPAFFTEFIGREREIEELLAVLESDGGRLLTLTGPGGIGKTRLSVEVARQLQARDGRLVVFVDLLPYGDPAMLMDAVMAACRLRSLPGVDALDQVESFFGPGPAIMVLDNFEHILEGAREAVMAIQERLPDLTCLVTSRRPLETPGESVFPVPPLGVPDDRDAEKVQHQSSVRLFVNRARLVRTDFALTQRNAGDIASACRRLEGVPLAIELAAAWSGVLTPMEICSRLEKPLALLVSRRRDFPDRHRALRIVLDETADLLTEAARAFFPSLAVFRGGWDVEAAEAICGADALLNLDELRRCSMLLTEERDGRTRFRMLETLREYARERLPADDWDALANRHAEYYRSLGEAARDRLDGPEAEEWLDRLAAEEANIAAGVEWCLAGPGDVETGVALGEALRGLWEMRGFQVERCRWLAALLIPAKAAGPAVWARALGCASYMRRLEGDHKQALRLLEQSVELFRSVDDDLRLGFNLCLLGQLAHATGDPAAALRYHEESLEILERIDHTWGVAMTLSSLGKALAYQGEYSRARELAQMSLDVYRRLEDRTATATVLSVLALALFFQGELDASEARERESLELRTQINRPWGIAYSMSCLARIARYRPIDEDPDALLERSLAVFLGLGDMWGVAFAYHQIGVGRLSAGDPSAIDHLTKALELRRGVGNVGEMAETLESISRALIDSDPPAAATLWGAAAGLRKAAGVPVPAVDLDTVRPVEDALVDALGGVRYSRLVQGGAALSSDEAVARAVAASNRRARKAPNGRSGANGLG